MEILSGIIMGCAFSIILIAMVLQAVLCDSITLPKQLNPENKKPLHDYTTVKVLLIIILAVVQILLAIFILHTYDLPLIHD